MEDFYTTMFRHFQKMIGNGPAVTSKEFDVLVETNAEETQLTFKFLPKGAESNKDMFTMILSKETYQSVNIHG